MLSDIQDALESLGKPVFYGRAGNLDGGDLWDYIVFYRDALRQTTDKNGFADVVTVAIVQEEYVDDATIDGVISKMRAIPGVRLADGDMSFDYTTKPKTETVIEVLILQFVKPRKACA